MSSNAGAPSGPSQIDSSRWAQLAFGVACMVAASNIQYSWTQFVPEIQKAHGWERAAIQTAFSIFVVVQTWCTPFVGAFIDRFGPRLLVLFGGVLTGLAWVINSYATTLPGFYVGSVVGGLGVGAVYATCINNAIKWFPDRRGLGVGLTAAGYGSGTILTVVPIAQHDRVLGIPGRVLHVWPDPGRRDRRLRLVPARTASRRRSSTRRTSPSRAATTPWARRFGRPCSGSCWRCSPARSPGA